MRVIVVGAGAWGFAAAAELARRGHYVTLVDRYGPGNPLSSSGGPTRLWRIADPERRAIRFGRRSIEALDRLAGRTDLELYLRTGLLWRDGAAPLSRLEESVRAEDVDRVEVAAADVGRFLPGLRPDGRNAYWFPKGGPLLASAVLSAYHRELTRHGGTSVIGPTVTSVGSNADSPRVLLDSGQVLESDVVVACPGPGASALLQDLGLDIPLQPFLEQVVHLGDPGGSTRHDALACLFDGPNGSEPGIYTMPTPGVGYKIGLDTPLRALSDDDPDRTPHPATTTRILERARRDLRSVTDNVVDELVCCWTDSPDGWFVVDRVGAVVIACGDSGKGFKYSAGMGKVLADLAEGDDPDSDGTTMSGARFLGSRRPVHWVPTALGGD